MNKNEWKKWVGVVGRMLLAYALVLAQGAWATQNQATKEKSASPQKSAAQQANEKQSSVATGAKSQTEQAQGEQSESNAQEKRSGKGAHEGITVHGHWTIEVRNQDGSLARHLEFENSLDPGFTTANISGGTTPLTVPGGASYLSAILTGQWSAPIPPTPTQSSSPAFWSIWLVGPPGLTNLPSTTNTPCAVTQGTVSAGICVIQQAVGCAASTGISCNLTAAPLGTAPAFTGIQLSGSIAVNQTGQISTVATVITGFACLSQTNPNCLPGNGVDAASFTSSTNFPGAPISVIAGQTVAVTVNISFS